MEQFPVSRVFGCLPNGEAVEAWTLYGAGGITVEAITYGATITRLLAPDRDGNLADVVLGFEGLNPYLTHRAYFGATVGRVAGRIPHARFCLDGANHDLARNAPPNHLHGGNEGLDKKLWTVSEANSVANAPSLRMEYFSPDGENGYPGNAQITVTYTVTQDNALVVETDAISDRPTPLSLTHHSYFNLAGEASGTVAGHTLQIFADEFVPADDDLTFLGRLESVVGRGNDLREPHFLKDVIPQLFQNHGDLYALRGRQRCTSNSDLAPAARLVHAESGRILNVFTTEMYLQLYTGAALDGSLIGKSGVPYARYAGLCLECEGYPDGANIPEIGDIVLRPGMRRRQTTAYAFSSQAH